MCIREKPTCGFQKLFGTQMKLSFPCQCTWGSTLMLGRETPLEDVVVPVNSCCCVGLLLQWQWLSFLSLVFLEWHKFLVCSDRQLDGMAHGSVWATDHSQNSHETAEIHVSPFSANFRETNSFWYIAGNSGFTWSNPFWKCWLSKHLSFLICPSLQGTK